MEFKAGAEARSTKYLSLPSLGSRAGLRADRLPEERFKKNSILKCCLVSEAFINKRGGL